MNTAKKVPSSSEDTRDDVQDDEVIGRALRQSLIALVTVAVVALAAWGILASLKKPAPEVVKTEIALPEVRDVGPVQIPPIPFTDITAESGIDWTHVSGMEGEKLLPETMGGGVAVFDYDQDGDQDILFVGGTTWKWSATPNANPRSLCLFQNDGRASFTDVTESVGLKSNFYAMAPTVGDYDNDGWPDLFITAVGDNHLFKNNQGTFTDVTSTVGLAGPKDAWSTSATWIDYDKDGLLDLFVCQYVVWRRQLDLSLGFSLTGIGRAFGQPTAFTGTQSRLYHNVGGKFSDVSKEMGIEVTNVDTGVPVGKGLAVAAIDVDHDGWTDLMVANDTVRNFLFLNREGKEFEESGTLVGVAFDRSGNSTGAMGIDCGYLRNDESLAIAIGNFANEQSSLYMSRGPEPPFNDRAMTTGLGPKSRLSLTFGMFFADLDLDSRQDIVCSNGHLEAEIAKVQSTQQYAQPPQFFWNAGSQGSTELIELSGEHVGESALKRMVGRGAAYGDFDGDGDLDVVLVANSSAARVLRNDQQLDHHWVRVQIEGSGNSNRDGYGSLVSLTSSGKTQRRIVASTRSYLSQCESVVTFGLGADEAIDSIVVDWPDGTSTTIENPEIDRLHFIRKP